MKNVEIERILTRKSEFRVRNKSFPGPFSRLYGCQIVAGPSGIGCREQFEFPLEDRPKEKSLYAFPTRKEHSDFKSAFPDVRFVSACPRPLEKQLGLVSAVRSILDRSNMRSGKGNISALNAFFS